MLPFSCFPCGCVCVCVCERRAWLPGNLIKAHPQPLPWLNAAHSPKRSAGKALRRLKRARWMNAVSPVGRPETTAAGSPVKEAQLGSSLSLRASRSLAVAPEMLRPTQTAAAALIPLKANKRLIWLYPWTDSATKKTGFRTVPNPNRLNIAYLKCDLWTVSCLVHRC